MVKKISKNKQAHTYALALLEASKDKKTCKKVFEEVSAILESINNDGETWKTLSSHSVTQSAQQEIISSICKKLKLSVTTTNTLKVISENKKLCILDDILKEFISLYYKDNDIIEVNVCSALKLSSDLDKKLKSALENKLNSKIVIKYEIKPEILGGLRISYNSFLIDDTLQTKLANIKKLILTN